MEVTVEESREAKVVEREGTCEAKRACRLEMCLARRREMWVVNR